MAINRKLIPPTNSLIMFEAAARLGSLTKAANELCITPTAVSKQLKNLETFLKTELFIRSKQGVELTAEGRRYLDKVTTALTMLADETQLLNEETSAPALNIEVGSCFLHFWLLPRLDQFRQAHPDVLINLAVNNERYVGTNENYDVAFFYSQVDTINRTNYLVFHERILLVCSPSFLHKRGGKIDLRTLFDQPLIMLKDELPSWEGWQSWSDKMGLEYQVPASALMVDDQVAVIQAAINDAGIALAWDWQVRDLLDSGQLVAITDTLDFPDKAYFLTISEQCSNPAAQTFISWVVGEEQAHN
ncbi:LysR substrate-binding domain-containing protein [Vibrio sp. CDRSL-10 TSBA]